jgi:tetratricopeptide (TPR) repeat protein
VRGLAQRVVQAASVFALLTLVACATPPQTDRLLADPDGLPRRAEVADVPFYPQEKYYCGPAALAMTLTWSGLPVTQDEIAPQVYTPGREGTLQSDVLAAARRNERLAVPVGTMRDLLAELAAGHPVLVFQNLGLDWYPQWHYAVAIGYDLNRGDLVLHSGTERRYVTPLSTFERTWARGGHWALVVLPPGELPATADEATVLRAATGLEQAERYDAAAAAYAAVAERWPDSLGAWMGLGNARYAAGDLEAAEAAFRTATERHPGAAAAWNNLAHVLGEKGGRRAEALAAAERAVSLGGNQAATYRATLDEIAGR